jgi:hypothetical protein
MALRRNPPNPGVLPGPPAAPTGACAQPAAGNRIVPITNQKNLKALLAISPFLPMVTSNF